MSLAQLSALLSSGLSRLVILFLLICLLSTYLYGNQEMNMAKQIMYIVFWESMYLLFYVLSYNSDDFITEGKNLFKVMVIPITILMLASNVLRGGMSYELTKAANNMVFYLLTLSPWLLLSKEQFFRLGSILFVMAMTVISLKRSAMTIAVISVGIVIYLEYVKGKGNAFRSFIVGMVAVLFAVCLVYFANNLSGGVAKERMDNIEEDGGSGRLNRYEDVIRLLMDEDETGKLVFGHGYRTIENSLGEHKSAHNDFLEVVYDYGFIGLVFLVMIHIALIKRVFYLRRTESRYYEGYLISYVIFFVMCLVSHLVIYPTYFIFLTSYWGAIEGMLMTSDYREC